MIRCPYHEASHVWANPPLTDKELWEYWSDLVGLTLAGLPEERLYFPNDFRNQKKKEYRMVDIERHFLHLGKRLVPQRYVGLQPQIEGFSWIMP